MALGNSVSVAIIDSGWSIAHQVESIRQGVSICDLDRPYSTYTADYIGHGTACGDIVLRFASLCEIVPVRIMCSEAQARVTSVIAAIRWAIHAKVPVINISMAMTDGPGVESLYYWCGRAAELGHTIVASSTSKYLPCFPAAFDSVLGVGVLPQESLELLRASDDDYVDFYAKGYHEHVRSTRNFRKSVYGSSYAAPVVSALAAQILEYYPACPLDEMSEHLSLFF